MKYVELYKLNNDGSQRTIAKCHLDKDGVIVCEGEEVFIQNLKKDGIQNYNDPKRTQLFFNDGLKFLEQLKLNFSSGYLNASEIIN